MNSTTRSERRTALGGRTLCQAVYSRTHGRAVYSRTLCQAALLAIIAFVAGTGHFTAAAEDLLTVQRERGRGEVQMTGTILDLTGEWLHFRSAASGREDKIERHRVLRWQTERTATHQQALTAMQEQRWADAVRGLLAASSEDSRVWMRRQIHADISLCAWNAGEIASAVEHFSIVCQSDPTTEFWACAPLNWDVGPAHANLASQASQWTRETLPVKRLLGASWLLRQQPAAAEPVLNELLAERDRRIVALAEAQLWRRRVVLATADEVRRWETRLRGFPLELRHGPAIVIGRAWSRLKAFDDAALGFMRAPIEHPEQRTLASYGLLEAGAALQGQGSHAEALRVYRELLSNYANTEAASLAQSRAELLERP